MITQSKKNEISKYLTDEELKLLVKVEKRNDTFSEFLNTIDEVKWFFPLKILGKFSPTMMPAPHESKKGMFSIAEWDILSYLEKITTNELPEEIMTEVLNIIENVTNFHENNDKQVIGYEIKTTDNYRTWWFFIKILCNIPNNRITSGILNYLRLWLKSTFDVSMQTAEITNKLIPKFLNDSSNNSDIEKFEIIFGILTEIKERKLPEEYRNVFGKKDFEFCYDFYWIKELLEKDTFVKLVGMNATMNFYIELIRKMKILLSEDDFNYYMDCGNDTIVISVKLDQDKIDIVISKILGMSSKDLGYVSMREDKVNLSKVIISELEITSANYATFINLMAKELIQKGLIASEDPSLSKIINYIYAGIFRKETYHSLYEEDEVHYSEPLIILGKVFRESLLVKTNQIDQNNFNLSKDILKRLLLNNFLYFKKIGIFLISESNNDFKFIFFETIQKQEVNYVILENLFFGDELKHFFEKLTNLDYNNLILLHDLIDRGSQILTYADDNENKNDIWKQKLFKSLSHLDYFLPFYEKLKEKTNEDFGLSATIHHTGFSFGSDEEKGKSKFTKDELALLENEEIVEIIIELQKTEANEEYTLGAFLIVFASVVMELPEKVTHNMLPFLKCKEVVIYNILNNLLEAWKNKRDIEWTKIFDFIKKYFKEINWKEELNQKYDPRITNPRFILDICTRLIDEGVKNDNWSMKESEVQYSFEVFDQLFTLIEYLSNDYKENVMDDYLTNSLNTILGKIIMAYVLAVRRMAVYRKENKSQIISEHLTKYSLLLEKNYMEAYAVFGSYINIFNYLDSGWVRKKIEYVEDLRYKESVLWLSFIDGYFWVGRVYLNLYKLMKKNYQMLLDFPERNDHANKGLINHLCIGFLEGEEDLTINSLFGKLINQKDYENLSNIIIQFWSLRYGIVFSQYDENVPEFRKVKQKRDRVIEFFEWMFNNYKDVDFESSSIEEKIVLSNLSKLSYYLYEIDSKNIKWLKLIVPYIFENFNSPFFIECLDKLKSSDLQSAIYLSEVFLEVLNIDVPRYDPKHIVSLLNYFNTFDDEKIKLNRSIILSKYLEYNKEIIKEFLNKD